MQRLPYEIIFIIFSYIIKITDKRRFSQTCRIYNNMTKKIIKQMESTIEIIHFNYKNAFGVEKFTLELCNDGYVNLIPKSYFTPKNNIIMDVLAIYGNITLLKMAKKNGCKLIKKNINKNYRSKNVCDYAIIGGNLEIYKWINSKGYKGNYNVCALAAACGHQHILKWARKHRYILDERTCRAAARSGHLDILIWARKHKCPWNDNVCRDAIKSGHLDILKWAIDNGCDFNVSWNYFDAALFGHLDIIKWMRGCGYVWDSETTRGAAQGGHLYILKCLRVSGCPWNASTCEWAAHNGHLHIIKWAIKNGCEIDKRAIKEAIQNNHYNVVDYLRKIECPE